MKNRGTCKYLTALLLAAALAAGCAKEEPRENPGRIFTVSDGAKERIEAKLREFSFGTIPYLTEKRGTGVCSPASAYLAFAALGNGMSEEERESLRALLLPDGVEYEEVNAYCAKLITGMNSAEKIALSTELLTAYDEDWKLMEPFAQTAEEYYQSDFLKADFQDPKTVTRLNDWIEEKTDGMIPEFFTEPFPEERILELMNTIYFKGKWEAEIDPEDTGEETFHGEEADTQAELMRIYDTVEYAENEVYQAVALAFQGGQAKLELYLPGEGRTLLETAELLQKESAPFDWENGTVEFPKFTAESTWDLLDLLKAVGYGDLEMQYVTELMEYQGTKEQEPPYISEAIQKAKLIVGEEGAEAAAATAIGLSGASMPEEEFTFRADRPFLYVLTFEGTPLFVGAVTQLE